jgi:hypothetical protein
LPSISEGIILKNLPTPEPSPKIFITLIFNFFLNILSKKKKKNGLNSNWNCWNHEENICEF